MPDFYTPALAKKLALTSPIWYDMTFSALCSSRNREVRMTWGGGHHTAVDQLADLAKTELRDRITAMKALAANPTLRELCK